MQNTSHRPLNQMIDNLDYFQKINQTEERPIFYNKLQNLFVSLLQLNLIKIVIPYK